MMSVKVKIKSIWIIIILDKQRYTMDYPKQNTT